MKKKSFLRNHKGFTIVELISVITISSILVGVAGVGISVFLTKFVELQAYADLQYNTVRAVDIVKNGWSVSESRSGNSKVEFMGAAIADSIIFDREIGSTRRYSRIRCMPLVNDFAHANDYIEFFWNTYRGALMVNTQFGMFHPAQPVSILPGSGDYSIFSPTSGDLQVTSFYAVPKKVSNTVDSRYLFDLVIEAEISINPERKRSVRYKTTVGTVRL